MPRRRSPVRTRSRRSVRRLPRRSSRRSPRRSPKRSPTRRSPKRRTGRTFRAAVGTSVTMKGNVSGATGSGTVERKDNRTIVVKDVSYNDDKRFLVDELVTVESNDWKVKQIDEDRITLKRHVDVEMLGQQTSDMRLSSRLMREDARLVGDMSSPVATSARESARFEFSDEDELANEPPVQGITRADTTVPSSLGNIVPPGAPRKRTGSDGDDDTWRRKSARFSERDTTQHETP